MAHNLLIQNGQASMFYINEVPWHGLGVRLDKPATAQEAITAANLDCHTLWAGFNGVTEWVDHRKSRQNENQRLNSAWFGESARVKSRAFSVAVDKIGVWN